MGIALRQRWACLVKSFDMAQTGNPAGIVDLISAGLRPQDTKTEATQWLQIHGDFGVSTLAYTFVNTEMWTKCGIVRQPAWSHKLPRVLLHLRLGDRHRGLGKWCDHAASARWQHHWP